MKVQLHTLCHTDTERKKVVQSELKSDCKSNRQIGVEEEDFEETLFKRANSKIRKTLRRESSRQSSTKKKLAGEEAEEELRFDGNLRYVLNESENTNDSSWESTGL